MDFTYFQSVRSSFIWHSVNDLIPGRELEATFVPTGGDFDSKMK